jgi:hypothetical protein
MERNADMHRSADAITENGSEPMDICTGIVILAAALILAVAYSPLAMNKLAARLRARAYALEISRNVYRTAYDGELEQRRADFSARRDPLSITTIEQVSDRASIPA